MRPRFAWGVGWVGTVCLLALVLVLVPKVLALDPSRRLHHYNCLTWSYQNGFQGRWVAAIHQTADGALLLGTARGLIRFDGIRFETLGIPRGSGIRNPGVQAIAPSRSGGVWLGLEKNAYGRFAPDGSWTLRRDPNGATDWDVSALTETVAGMLWVGGEYAGHAEGTNTPLERVFPASNPPTFVRSLLAGSRGRVWLGTVQNGLHVWQEGEVRPFDAPVLQGRMIHALAEDLAGHLWVGTESGVFCFDAEGRQVAADMPRHEVRCLLVDRHGVLWLGTTGNGLGRWSRGEFSALGKKEGLASDNVLALAEDFEGTLWVGTREGLNQITDVKLPTLSVQDGLPTEAALSVSPSPRGGIWVATSKGAVRFHDEGFEAISQDPAIASSYAKRVFESRAGDRYLVAGAREVKVIPAAGGSASFIVPGMPVALAEDSTGVVLSVSGELFRISPSGLQPFEYREVVKPELYWVLNLAPSRQGGLWVACVNGLFHVSDGRFRRWGPEHGLAGSSVRWVTEDSDGSVWVGTSAGISRLRNETIHTLGEREGLPNTDIWSVIPDSTEGLWVDTRTGLLRLHKPQLEEFFGGKRDRVDCTSFEFPESSIPADKTAVEQSAGRTTDGRLWFPNSKGVVLVDPDRVPTNRILLPVRIQGVRANGKSRPLVPSIYVEPGRGEVEIQYSAITLLAPSRVRYRYRLEGLDPAWVDAQDRKIAFFTNLRPGPYRFEVIAANADGVWTPQPASVLFELRPRFHQTLWFRALWGTAAIGLVAAVFGWRMSRLHFRQIAMQRDQERLEATVSERTASLQAEVQERLRAQSELEQRKSALEHEIEERKRAEMEVERIHRELLRASHQAGQAEVASSVLHNVGNILNSANVSTNLIVERLNTLRLPSLSKAAALLNHPPQGLATFLTEDERGRMLPAYLENLATHLAEERAALVREARELVQSMDHIKDVVATQQSYARTVGILEPVDVTEVAEQALKMNAAGFARHGVKIEQAFHPVPIVTTYRHKLLQILVNLLLNARHACDASRNEPKAVVFSIRPADDDGVCVEVSDNGVGIAPEVMPMLFRHGFTTRKEGHGFGLHSASLAAREMGAALIARSDGPGLGASFILRLPLATQPSSKSQT
jgi:ligand-binding sensor domain-containing protein/signal transduction histidine kinase